MYSNSTTTRQSAKRWNSEESLRCLTHSSKRNERLHKLIADQAFECSVIFVDKLAALHMRKKITFHRHVYVGMSVLELLKQLMYDFYYNHLKKEYEDRCELLYTETESETASSYRGPNGRCVRRHDNKRPLRRH